MTYYDCRQQRLQNCNYNLEGAIMSREVFDDETILEGFKNLRDIIESQQQLNKLIDQRLKNLEASQFRQPLVLTKEMEVKN